MASDNLGVDVCIEELDKESPCCPHGPTILFVRYGKGQPDGEKFYACSACRDRKDCRFYQAYGAKVSEEKQKAREEIIKMAAPPMSHEEYYKRFTEVKRQRAGERRFCVTCGLLLLQEEAKSHAKHSIRNLQTEEELYSPSHLFQPLENNKTNAQYLFSDKAVEFLFETFETLGYKKVLCVGCPRIHEAITKQHSMKSGEGSKPQLQSLLLDIDHRYQQFYSPAQFCRYNMFNHHFFRDEDGEHRFLDFVTGDDADSVVMVTDPPFGGLVEVMAHTVMKINKVWQEGQTAPDSDLPVMWIFPYFMEQRIVTCLPQFHMLDYKVDYDNHTVFQGGHKGRKLGSPVRIFTNIASDRVKLPTEEGYRFCKECKRYVAKENSHCKKCNACTSKDGHTYVHCDACGRCVKPSRVHCDTCKQCVLPDHACGKSGPQGCHICGDLGHKRRECPNKAEIFAERKRNKRKAESAGNESSNAKKSKKSFWNRKKQKQKKNKGKQT